MIDASFVYADRLGLVGDTGGINNSMLLSSFGTNAIMAKSGRRDFDKGTLRCP